MLNESSANLEQFMSWQMSGLYSSTPRDIWYTIPVLRFEDCFLPVWAVALPLPIISSLSLTVPYLSCLSCFFLDSPPSFCRLSVFFLLSLYVLMAFWSILCFHCFYHLSFPLCVFLPLTLPLPSLRNRRTLRGVVSTVVSLHYLFRHLCLFLTTWSAYMAMDFSKNAEERPEPSKADVKGRMSLNFIEWTRKCTDLMT